jgi:periplasmic protein TonB
MISLAQTTSRALRLRIGQARERLRANFGDKLTGALVALGLELLLVLLVLLSLGQVRPAHRDVPMATVAFDARDRPEAPPRPEKKLPAKAARASPQAQPLPQVAQAVPMPPPAVIIPVSPQQMRTFDISNLPKRPNAPAGPAIGPAYTPAFGDSKRVGTAPNGQPMYAASWYPHEPTDQELAGYLSTATGPAWGLITCKTVADYRVEDCVGLDEYPAGSNMLRAVLAAAWQFRVRPPRVNGVLQVGDWVRIRIDYEERAGNPYGGPASR